MKKLAIKGFDKDLKCRGEQYEIGGDYKYDGSIKLCYRGYHYGRTWEEVKRWYPDNGENRYCIIEVLGETQEGFQKGCTNAMKILYEVKSEDLRKGMVIGADFLCQMNNMGFVIGGSYALIIHGYDIDRKEKDLDLIIGKKQFNVIKNELFPGMKFRNFGESCDAIQSYYSVFGDKFDIIIDEDPHPVIRRWKGHKIIVQDEIAIWDAKLRYGLTGSIKHIEDIIKHKINFSMVTMKGDYENPYFDDLPF